MSRDDVFADSSSRAFDAAREQGALNAEIERWAVDRFGADWEAFYAFADVEAAFALSLPRGDWRRDLIVGAGS